MRRKTQIKILRIHLENQNRESSLSKQLKGNDTKSIRKSKRGNK